MSPPDDAWNVVLKRRLPAFWHFIVQRFRHGERYGLDLTLAFIVIAAALWAFVALVEGAVTESELQALDVAIQSLVAQILSPDVTRYVVFITDLGGTRGTVIGVVLVSIPLLFRRRWWSFFGLLFATGGGGLVVQGLKVFFGRARPAETVIEVGGFAFPSGHAFAAMVFYGYLIYLGHKHFRSSVIQVLITLAAFLMILLIGSSRVYLNVHWLTDVLGGFVAGLFWLVLSILIVRHVEWPDREAQAPHHDAVAPTDLSRDHPAGRSADQAPENTRDEAAEKARDQAADKVGDQPSRRAGDQPPKSARDQPPNTARNRP